MSRRKLYTLTEKAEALLSHGLECADTFEWDDSRSPAPAPKPDRLSRRELVALAELLEGGAYLDGLDADKLLRKLLRLAGTA